MRGSAVLALCVLTSAWAASDFHLYVAETPAGSVGQQSWAGVRRYNVSGAHGPAALGRGIDKALLSDPESVRADGLGELFVGNRHGNAAPSSVSRILYDFSTDSFSLNGTVTGNGLFGVHGVNFSPSGELFAANVNSGVSRFTRSGSVFSANGTFAVGVSTRDALVSPDGQWAYVTAASPSLRKYRVSDNALVGTFNIPGSGSLHNGVWRGSELFIGDYGSSQVFKVWFDANGDVAGSAAVASVNRAIGVAFSPDGQEMFVASHTGGFVARFMETGGVWVPNGTIQTGRDMGSLDVVLAVTPYAPTSFAIQLGRNANNGTAASLAVGGDGDDLQVCQFILPNLTLPYLRMTVTAADTGLATLSKARIDFRGASLTAGSFRLVLSARLAGGTGATRDTLTVDGFSTAAADQTVPLTAGTGSLADYLGTNGRLGCQIEVYRTGPSASFLPCSSIDKVVWSVLP